MIQDLVFILRARDEASKAIGAFKNAAASAASEVKGKFGALQGGLAKGLQGVQSVAQGVTGAISRVGSVVMDVAKKAAIVGGIVGTALIGIGVAGIGAASDLSESMNKVNVVFGDSADQVHEFASTAAQSLGQSRNEALQMAGTFGNLFTSMGLGQDEAAGLSTEIITLGSDLASFNNINPAEALDKLRAGLIGETEPLRALGVNLTAAAVEAKAFEMGIATSKETLTEAGKVQARYALILEQTKNAQGDFARTSTGMANSQRIIAAQFKDMRAEIGERLLPAVEPLISQFAVMLPGAFDAAMGVIGPFLDIVAQLVTQIPAAIEVAKGLFAAITFDPAGSVEGLQTLYQIFLALPEGIRPVAETLRDVWQIAQLVWEAFKILGEAAMFAIQGDFANAMGMLQNELREVTGALGEILSGWADLFLDWILPIVGPMLSNLASLASQMLSWASQQIPGIVSKLLEWGNAFIQWVGPKIPELITALRGLQSQLLDWIVTEAPRILGQLAAWAESFIAWVLPMIPDLLSELIEGRKEMFQWIMDQVPGLASQLGEWAMSFISWVAPAIGPLIDELLKLLETQLDWIVGQAPAILETFLGEWLPATLKWVVEAAKLIVPELLKILTSVMTFLEENGPTLAETFLSEWLPAAIKWVAQAAIDILPELIGLIGVVGGWLINVGAPKILNFALELGKAIVRGLVRGAQNIMPELISGISNLANSAINAAKSALGIASPSRVFMELGEEMGAGMVLGWLSMEGEMQAAVRDQLGMMTGDVKKDTKEMAKTVATALDQAANAYFDFQQDVSNLNTKLQIDLTKVGERMGREINNAIMDASRAIQDAQKQAESAISQAQSNLAESRALRARRDEFSEIIDARVQAFREGRQLGELAHRRDEALAEAKTEKEIAEANLRYDKALEEFNRQKQLAEEERAFMATIEAERRAFEDQLADEQLQKELTRIISERDARITAINEALDAKKQAIISSAAEETAALKAEHEKRIIDLREQVVDKIPDLTGLADETIVAFLEGITENIGGMAETAITDAGRIQQAIADVISAAKTAAQAVRDIPGVPEVPTYGHGTSYHPGGLAIVGDMGPELVNLPRGSQVIPNNQLGGMLGGKIEVNQYITGVLPGDVQRETKRALRQVVTEWETL